MNTSKLSDFSYNNYSQFGEDGIIEKIFEIIGTTTKLCVEFGAWNGFMASNTANLWTKDWQGILIESDMKGYKELAENVKNYNCLSLYKFVSPEGNNSLENILNEANINKTLDLLSIDIDGDDYYILKSLNKIRPRVIICEYNPTIPPNFELVQVRGEVFGASSVSIINLAKEKNYTLVSMTETNCIFVIDEEISKFSDYYINYPEIAPTKHLTYLISDYKGNFVLSRIPTYGIRFPLAREFAKGQGFGFWGIINYFRNKIVYNIERHVNSLLTEKPVVPQTHYIKTKILKEYASKYSLNTFIETGTYFGDTVYALKNNFKKIISIELSEELCNRAREKFSKDKHISIFNGDSGVVIKSVLDSLKEPALFWLDGHYSGGITAKGELDTPIIKELQHILSHPIKNHVILIDDARCFTGERDYPNIKELVSIISKLNNDLNVNIEDDIIRIYPNVKGINISSRSILHSYAEPWRSKTGRIYRKTKKLARGLAHHDENKVQTKI